MSDLKVGDTIRLNSGGPLMTVQDLDDKVCHAIWMKDQMLLRETFSRQVVSKSSDPHPWKPK